MNKSQASDAWKRFCSWYGADAIERKYGLTAPADWVEVLGSLDRDLLARALADVRVKYPTWMPSLPEFETLTRQLSRPQAIEGPSMQERLIEFALRNYRLTPEQVRMPWRFLHTGNRFNGESFAVTGVDIPADGENTGYRVMCVDLAQAAA